ncbi:MAG: hypoxanthine phosphoribosyltransferase [Candidatus Cloacimonetes bacterium]|jgi:hypoxanthine phosphoribosyltransferase|uniref:Hypoxanthine phosphoribosyltransferase n=1 Tax=Candidatus Syntrophosphaera thermopropionivorans TaxID=2593015 RepID=A0AC61QHR3_9BACT|nr:hypoxanthine phosphoribosyltransferase [Candidatus Syntrophosphaera thermopropionivorans]MBP7899627.1 hypoxanthine phosphoribosyltransferase [Candidatus Syntrophosphaera sp.]NLA45191.1 hypoxanthine phosphoribosyltransferase [Candidatus Cloacimonadota bacterium]MBP7932448.1 hypoxanthine phosphoribosyltransferase [Candidatus Syntrophosphaera sp.]MBP9006672.1 hypoxanthine phosphoribosyltransferase [Candidatus Syntrophosphaera sp.]TDF72516.1 hypoxanthine phosphoribosyltransferase [Candidatus Sy
MNKMNCDLAALLFDEFRIQSRVREIGMQITQEYKDKVPILVGILKGGFMFLADLCRSISIPVELDFLAISSYGKEASSSGVVKIRKDIDLDITGRDVIIVEDIVDTGLSLQYIKEYLSKHSPATLKTCVLLDKPAAHKIDVSFDYVGFEIGNEFIVGYGLDYNEQYRNLPYLGILKEELYK